MTASNKIISVVLIWAAVSAAIFGFVVPKLGNSLVAMTASHQKQIDELNDLQDQLRSLQKMQEDLRKVEKEDVKPADLFTSDVRLAKEIQYIEAAAAKNNLSVSVGISGTVDKAKAVEGSKDLFQYPYSLTLKGKFADILNFVRYMEKSYFVSPISSIAFSAERDSGLTANILANFYIVK